MERVGIEEARCTIQLGNVQKKVGAVAAPGMADDFVLGMEELADSGLLVGDQTVRIRGGK